MGLIREKLPALLHAAVARRSWVCLDLALDLLVLPLSYVVVNVIGIIVTSAFSPTAFVWHSSRSVSSTFWRSRPTCAEAGCSAGSAS